MQQCKVVPRLLTKKVEMQLHKHDAMVEHWFDCHCLLEKIQPWKTLSKLVMCMVVGLEQTLMWLMKLTTHNTLSDGQHNN